MRRRVWQGDPPLPVLTRVRYAAHDYEWDSLDGGIYRITRTTWASANIWEIARPDGTSDSATTLRDARRWIAQHYRESRAA